MDLRSEDRGWDNRGSTVINKVKIVSIIAIEGHGGRVVTLLPPTSKAGVRFTARP